MSIGARSLDESVAMGFAINCQMMIVNFAIACYCQKNEDEMRLGFFEDRICSAPALAQFPFEVNDPLSVYASIRGFLFIFFSLQFVFTLHRTHLVIVNSACEPALSKIPPVADISVKA